MILPNAQATRRRVHPGSMPLAALALLGFACAAAPAQPLAPAEPRIASGSPESAPTVDRSRLPAPSELSPWSPPRFTRLKPGGTLDAIYLHQGPAPLVSLRLVLPRGAASDPKGADGLTNLMAELLDEGAGARTALELEAELQKLATDYTISVTTDELIFKIDALADTFAASVALLADIVRRPRFDTREFQRLKEDLTADAVARRANPHAAAFAVVRRALFGEGYASQSPAGTTRSLKQQTLAQVKQHYSRVVQPEGATFIVTGGIEQSVVETVLAGAFGDWKGSAKAAARPVAELELLPRIHFVDFPGATQSFVALAMRAEPTSTDVLFPAMVYNRAFGGAFTSRLNLNLREAKGFTYGSDADFARWRASGMYVLQASVKADTTRATIDEVRRELTDICSSRPLTEQELSDAVSGLLLGFPGRFEHNSVIAEQIVDLVADGRSDDWYEKWPDRVRQVGLADAQGAAARYCRPDNYVIVVAGDKASVGPLLAPLNLSVLDYDAEGYIKR